MSIRPPQIPSIPASVDPNLRKAVAELKRVFEEIVSDGGIATVSQVTRTVATSVAAATVGGIVSTTPDVPTSFTATGKFRTIDLFCDPATFTTMEVWRATSDDRGAAVKIGTSKTNVYSDTPPDASLSITYYYWVRFIGANGEEGPFSGVTSAHTADDPMYVMELLQNSKWQASTAYSLNTYGYPTRPNGKAYKVTTAGTSGTTEPVWPTTLTQTVNDGTAVWTCEADLELESPFMVGLVGGIVKMVIRDVLIGDATITNAKIYDLAVEKLTGDTIEGKTIQTAASGKRFVVDAASNEAHFYGDRGDGTVEELASVGIKTSGSDTVIGYFGSTNSDRLAVFGISKIYGGVVGVSTDSVGVSGYSTNSYGVTGNGIYGGSFSVGVGNLVLTPSIQTPNPTHVAAAGSLWMGSTGAGGNAQLWKNYNGSTGWTLLG